MTLVSCGVVPLSKDIDESRKTFEFAKEVGLETISSEPPKDAFDTIQRLCDEYKINLAIHDHPKPSLYWNPDAVVDVCKGRKNRSALARIRALDSFRPESNRVSHNSARPNHHIAL